MKIKLIFSTATKDTEQWVEMPVIPRTNEWINVVEILKKEDLVAIWQSSRCWTGNRGTVESVEYRRGEKDFYAEVYVWCED